TAADTRCDDGRCSRDLVGRLSGATTSRALMVPPVNTRRDTALSVLIRLAAQARTMATGSMHCSPSDHPGETRLKYKIGVNIRNMINLICRHLYTERNVVIRELIQNARDSVYDQHGDDAAELGRIQILSDGSAIEVRDNGTGMNEAELKEYLSTLAAGIK